MSRQQPGTEAAEHTGSAQACGRAALSDESGVERFDLGFRTEDEIRLLASDVVPRTVRADAYAMLGFMDMLERNALKPEHRNGRRR